jgi:hypothetical protein
VHLFDWKLFCICLAGDCWRASVWLETVLNCLWLEAVGVHLSGWT